MVEQEVHEHVPLEETDTVYSALWKAVQKCCIKILLFPFDYVVSFA